MRRRHSGDCWSTIRNHRPKGDAGFRRRRHPRLSGARSAAPRHNGPSPTPSASEQHQEHQHGGNRDDHPHPWLHLSSPSSQSAPYPRWPSSTPRHQSVLPGPCDPEANPAESGVEVPDQTFYVVKPPAPPSSRRRRGGDRPRSKAAASDSAWPPCGTCPLPAADPCRPELPA
jgi:hypothetical protein